MNDFWFLFQTQDKEIEISSEPKTTISCKEYKRNKKFRKFIKRHSIAMSTVSPVHFSFLYWIAGLQTFVFVFFAFVIGAFYTLHIALYTLVFIDVMNENIKRGLRFWGYIGYGIMGIVFYIPLTVLILVPLSNDFMNELALLLLLTHVSSIYSFYPLAFICLFIMSILAALALVSNECKDKSTKKWLYICFFVPIVGSIAYRFRKRT